MNVSLAPSPGVDTGRHGAQPGVQTLLRRRGEAEVKCFQGKKECYNEVQKSRRAVQTGEEARGIITRQDRTSCFDAHNAYPPGKKRNTGDI